MSTTVTRKYKTKDVEMLTATATIIENAIANKTLLQSKRTTWADPFFDDLKTQIQTTTDTYLGKDAAQLMRQATQVVLTIQHKLLMTLLNLKYKLSKTLKTFLFTKQKF